jgi:hypothetical protein
MTREPRAKAKRPHPRLRPSAAQRELSALESLYESKSMDSRIYDKAKAMIFAALEEWSKKQ